MSTELTQLFLPAARILLPLAYGYALVRDLNQGRSPLHSTKILALCIALLPFHAELADGMKNLGDLLHHEIEARVPKESLKAILIDTYQKTLAQAAASGNADANTDEAVRQALRLGVWGVMRSVSEFFFIAAQFIIEVGSQVLWTFLKILCPLFIALGPALPRIGIGALSFCVELCLWMPLHALWSAILAPISLELMRSPGSLGVRVVVLELTSVVLTLSIPWVANRVVTGAFGQFSGLQLQSGPLLAPSRDFLGSIE